MSFFGQGLRIFLLTFLVLVGFSALVHRLYEFQIERRAHYQALVPGDREVTVREPGIRGRILDSNGVELARNRRTFEVYFDLEEIHRSYRAQHENDPKRDILTREEGMPRLGEETDIVQIVNSWIIPELTRHGVAKNYSSKRLRTHFITHRGLVPFSYTTEINEEQFARLAEHSIEIPGVYINVRPLREYPYGAVASHILGYTRPWKIGDVPEDQKRRFNHYIGDEQGIAGVEASFDDILRGPEGNKTLVKNEKGKITGMIDYRPPHVGADVRLTIDARVQYLLTNVLRRTGRASGVVMDVRTGGIVAMASVPDYDPNDYIPSIDKAVYDAYLANPCSPFTDRSISGFVPGSTFKLGTALAGVMHGMGDRSYHCAGFVSYGTYKPKCWNHSGHGTLALSQAIQRSCNPYFYRLGNALGEEKLIESLTLLGFGAPTGIELPAESGGNLPGSRAWRAANRGARLNPGDIAQISIGQFQTLASPLQLCAMVTCIANGGRYYIPRLLDATVLPDGQVLRQDPKLKFDLIRDYGVKPEQLERIRKGMWMAVNVPGGTAGRAKIPGVDVAAKTGTAQVDKIRNLHNAWTVAFAPFDDPKYAIAVLVEDGKAGGGVGAPLVHLILRGILARDEGMRLPLGKLDPVEGNKDPVEAIELPEDVLAAIDATEMGETGDEALDLVEVRPAITLPTENPITPEPAITPEVDEEGSVVPDTNPETNP